MICERGCGATYSTEPCIAPDEYHVWIAPPEDNELSEKLMKLFENVPTCECHWPNIYFDDALKEFTCVRLQIHKARKLEKAGERITPLSSLFNRATQLRHRLQMLAPCKDCIEKYNPTGRKSNRIWNPNRQRAYKEALQ